MNNPVIAFFGAPSFSAELLQRLSDVATVNLVVTQPDRPVGRKSTMTPTPVKEMSQRLGIAVYDSPLAGNHEISSIIRSHSIDLVILFAFGEMIKKDLLEAPQYGIWNVHPSLLPLYRGASPTAFPILLGDSETGVTLMQMDEVLDHGPILAQTTIPLDPTITRDSLEKHASEVAFHQIRAALETLSEGKHPQSTVQLHKQATYTRTLTKQDGYVPVEMVRSAITTTQPYTPPLSQWYTTRNPSHNPRILPAGQAIYNLYRSLQEWPGIWTTVPINGIQKRLKISECECHHDLLILKRVQLEGKQPVDFATFNNAYRVF